MVYKLEQQCKWILRPIVDGSKCRADYISVPLKTSLSSSLSVSTVILHLAIEMDALSPEVPVDIVFEIAMACEFDKPTITLLCLLNKSYCGVSRYGGRYLSGLAE